MKRLTCEMCGSTDLLKEGGVFVCQSCGCKYSVEEAKKMMIEGTVEVTGTVKVDDSAKIKNYLEMAQRAFSSDNFSEAITYANKILESDVNNWQALILKGKATAWSANLRNNTFDSAVESWKKAFPLVPKDNLYSVITEVLQVLKQTYTCMLALCLSSIERCTDIDIISDCVDTMKELKLNNVTQSIDLIARYREQESDDEEKEITDIGIGDIPLSQFKKNVTALTENAERSIRIWTGSSSLGDGARNDVGAVAAMELIVSMLRDEDKLSAFSAVKNGYDQISHALRAAQFNSSSMEPFYRRLRNDENEVREELREEKERIRKEKQEAERKEREARIKKYWEAHPEEKTSLESEKRRLNNDISSLNSRIANMEKNIKEASKTDPVPSAFESAENKKKITDLEKEKSELGIFSIKRKKQIAEEIESLTIKNINLKDKIAEETSAQKKEIDIKIAPMLSELQNLKSELKMYNNRVSAINAKLTRDPGK